MKISRLFEIIYILLDKEVTTAKELADYFEVSTRTIYRDIDTLSSAGIPIYTNKGKGGGISLIDSFKLDKTMLTKEEQSDILLALQSINSIDVGNSSSALNKLSTFFKKSEIDWIDIDFSYWNNGKNDKEKFELIKTSIINRQLMMIEYCNSNGITSKREIKPFKLLYKGLAWYLYAFCNVKNDYRIFKLTRIKTATKVDEFFEEDEKTPKLKTYEMKRSKEIQLKLKIDQSIAFRVYDDFPPESIEETPDGYFIVNVTMNDEDWLISFILSYGKHIECIEPKHIREKVKQTLEESRNKYLQ